MSILIVRGRADRTITAAIDDGESSGTLHWGDGTSIPYSWAERPVRHTYEAAGAYTVTLRGADGAVIDAQRIFARTGEAPVVTFTADADNPNIIDATWGDEPADLTGQYDLDWDDGTEVQTVTAAHGRVVSHGLRAGDYTIRIYDRDARRWGRYPITVHDKQYDPEFELTRLDERTVKLTVTRLVTPGKDVLVDWGDGTQDTIGTAQVGSEVQHSWDFDDVYIVQCVYADGSTDGSADTVEIPWAEAARGPKPTSEIIWSADALAARGVWLRWIGSGWHYTIHWGDGASDRVTSWDKSVKHVYAEAGTYQVVCVSDLHQDWTAAVEVTVRDTLSPGASFALVAPGSNQVRATLASVAAPVRYQIGWGDHVVTEHGAGDLEPVHEYAWNTPAPSIVVRDVPAKRLGRFTGPDIGPAPDPDAPIDGFYLEYVSQNSDSRRFRLRGGGIPPGETLTWYPHHLSWYRDVTADENGQIRDEIDIPRGINADFDYRWFSFGIVGSTVPRQYIPVHPNRAAQGLPDLTYQINVDDPYELEFSATPPMLGRHVIDFGDGVQTTVDVRSLPMRVQHRYTDTENITASVTFPDGRTATRQVRGYTPAEPCFNYHYPGSCTVTWLFNGWEPTHPCPAGGERGSEEYSPVIINNGYHPPHQVHRPDNSDGWHVAYGYGMPVGSHVFKYTSTFRPTSDHPVNITKAAPFKRLDPPPIELIVLGGDSDMTAWFGNVTEWDGGYSGEFYVTNNTDEAALWQVDFTVDAPGVVREAWPSTVELVQLAETRWRLRSTQALGSHDTAVAGIRVEPPGDPDKFPRDIAAQIPD